MVGTLHGEDRGALAAAQELRVGHALELRDQARGGEEATVPQDADAVLVAGDHVAELVADEPRVRAVPVQEGQGLVAIGDRLGDGRQVELGDEDLPLVAARAPGLRSDVATSAQYCCDPYSCRGTAQGVRAMTEMVQSYAHGTSAVPLIGQTIGENLAATVARFPDHEALVVPFQDVRLTYARARRRGRRRGPRPARGSASRRATGSGSGARTTPSGCSSSTPRPRIGAILVNINPAYRTHEVEYALHQSGCRLLVAAHRVQGQRLRGDGGRGAPDGCPRSSAWSSSAPPDWDELRRRGRHRRPTAALRGAVGRAAASTTRSTSSTRAARRASRRAPRSATTTS